MSYRAGIGRSVATLWSMEPCEPHIVCDGCRRTMPVSSKTEHAARWFLAGKPPPGWRGCQSHDGRIRMDLCPRCWRAPSATQPLPTKAHDRDAAKVAP